MDHYYINQGDCGYTSTDNSVSDEEFSEADDVPEHVVHGGHGGTIREAEAQEADAEADEADVDQLGGLWWRWAEDDEEAAIERDLADARDAFYRLQRLGDGPMPEEVEQWWEDFGYFSDWD